MTTADAWTGQPIATPSGPSPMWGVRTRYAPQDFVTLLWRERWLMIFVFLVIFLAGLAFAFTLKTSYSAHSSLLIGLGQEYVYEPRAGDAARGAVPEANQVIQSEAEILGSDQLKDRVIDRIGLKTLYPALAAKGSPGDGKAAALKAMRSKLAIETAPDTSVVRVTFEHPDREMAAKVVNTLLEEYLIYRRTVLQPVDGPMIQAQRQAFEAKLADTNAAYQTFLADAGVGDFDGEKASLTQLQAQLEQQRFSTESQLRESQGQLGSLNSQISQVAPETDVYRDRNLQGDQKLVELKVQLEDLMGRYQPTSDPVRQKKAEIAQMEAALASGRTQGDSARRVGANPVYQTVQTQRIDASTRVAALQQTLAAVRSQLAEVTRRQMQLASLEPRYQSLSRDRTILQDNVRDFSVREQQSDAAKAIADHGADNIRIVERAMPASQGKSLKKPVATLAILFAGFSALCAGLLHMYLRPGIPTPSAAGRTLDLPVLGYARLRRG
ncbi:GumC family protein [soil metagenome]